MDGKMRSYALRFALVVVTVVAIGAVGYSDVEDYEFISPMPGSTANSPESTIIVREGSFISAGSVTQQSLTIVGSKSGAVTGRIVLSSDGKTIIFEPDRAFLAGETVEVTVQSGIATSSGRELPRLQFSFEIVPFAQSLNPYEYIPELRPNFYDPPKKAAKNASDPPPDNFPKMDIEILDEAAIGDGYIFLAVASDVEGVGYHLMMLNNDGTPFFYRELMDDYAVDFKMQPNGQLSYAQFIERLDYTGGADVVHKLMDNSFTVVDNVQMGNGYIAESHDFQILPNGHFLLFGYYMTPVDMSQIVQGGQPDALVTGGIVQELDVDKNVVFQWRSWDYYDFETFPFRANRATNAIVHEFHLNTINLDDDGHIFIGTPGWVKKINRQTGEIIWHLGGDENEFTFVNVDSTEGVDLVAGHGFHRLPSGNILVYDNGNRQGTRSSRANELVLDELNKTVELVWSYIPDPLIPARARGNAQRLPNGNTVIGWGGGSSAPMPDMTEVNEAGEKIFELTFDPTTINSYRAFRFPFTAGAPAAEVAITEVVPGNTYDFVEGDVDTGISMEMKSLDNAGYNELTVRRYDFAPLEPQFVTKAPRVKPARMVLDRFAITSFEADVQFHLAQWGMSDPSGTVVYQREFEGQGLFLPLPTVYNPVKQIIEATTDKFGEFILTSPDFASFVFTPTPVKPVDEGSVNQTLPVMLEWAPTGYATSYDLQIARESSFTDLVVDLKFATESIFTLDVVDENETYFWRVRATNDAGTSDWSAVKQFTATAPFVNLTAPNGLEDWQLGLDYYIRWQDNLDEDVILSLERNGQPVQTITTTPSDGAYEWEVDLTLDPLPDYKLKIESSLDGSLFDKSDAMFSVIDTTGVDIEDATELPRKVALHQNYPNPFNPETTIVFELPAPEHVILTLYDLQGRKVATLHDGRRSAGVHTISFEATDLASGIYLYELKTQTRSIMQKMIVVK